MGLGRDHIEVLDKQINSLSDGLAHLGRGTTMAELLRLIRFERFITPAEFALLQVSLDSVQVHIQALEALQTGILTGAKQIVEGDTGR